MSAVNLVVEDTLPIAEDTVLIEDVLPAVEDTIPVEDHLQQDFVKVMDKMDQIIVLMQTEDVQEPDIDLSAILQQQNDLIVEGSFFVGLCVIISFAVYMFWSQMSKW